MVLVVCALRAELRYLRPREGIEIAEAGVGPVEAAIATARALALAPYAAVVNAGIAGAFRDCAKVGDALLVCRDALADLGWEGGAALELPGGARLVDRQEGDESLLRRCAALGLQRGSGVTVSSVTTTDSTAARLRARYAADVESMEGFSVLRAAAVARVPALQVRGVSNYVGSRSEAEWNFTAGARATAAALDAVLDCLVT